MADHAPDTLVVLGASADQLFLIRTAQEMGLRVLAVDMSADAPGMAAADESAAVSTRDTDALKRLLDERMAEGTRFAGVTTMGSDIPQIVAEVAEHLGTPSVSRQTAAWTTDKYAMKRRLESCGVRVPAFRETSSAAELEKAAEELGLPVVVKPVDRSGARGVRLVRDHSGLAPAYECAVEESFSGRVMVERYVEGRQISTETIMVDGAGVTPGFADRNYEFVERFSPNIIENGGWIPSSVDEETRAEVEDLVVRASIALSVRTGVTKGDVVLSPDGPMIIEMAARLSGGDFSESLVPLSSGVNYVRSAIQLAIGRKPDLDELRKPATQCVANRYFFPEPGRLVRVDGIEAVRETPWVVKLDTWYRLGEQVPPVGSHAQRFGVFVVVAPDREELERRIRWVYDSVHIETEAVDPS